MASLCNPWFTTTNLSYRFPIFETSATALCGTTGNKNWQCLQRSQLINAIQVVGLHHRTKTCKEVGTSSQITLTLSQEIRIYSSWGSETFFIKQNHPAKTNQKPLWLLIHRQPQPLPPIGAKNATCTPTSRNPVPQMLSTHRQPWFSGFTLIFGTGGLWY